MLFLQHQVRLFLNIFYSCNCCTAQFIYNRENSQGPSLMSYMSTKDPIPMSPLNISSKSGDASVMSFDIKVDGIPEVSAKDGKSLLYHQFMFVLYKVTSLEF